MQKIIGFCHEYDKEHHGCFSNWYQSDFTIDGRTFLSGEQYMMYQKAILFDEKETAEKIMNSARADEVKMLGGPKGISKYREEEWAPRRQAVMYRGLLAKFDQNQELRQELLSTGDAILAECSPSDHIWGIGLAIEDPRIQYPSQWRGRNLLGYTLMRVRQDLQKMDAGISPLMCGLIAPMNISIVQADITTLSTDAIINAANSSLLGGGGVDGAIHRAAGPELLAECRTLGGANTGEAKITNGYHLPAKYVIHTVGPVWSGGDNREAGQLANCYRRSLALALMNDIHTIAFPSISTGAYGYPLRQAAHVAMCCIVEFLQNNPGSDLSVTLAAFDARTKAAYEDALSDAVNLWAAHHVYSLSNEELNTLNEDTIFAVSIASGGAMGCPGEVRLYLLCGDSIQIALGNFCYGDLDMEQLNRKFTIFNTDTDLRVPGKTHPDWVLIDTGAGNSLFVRQALYTSGLNTSFQGKRGGPLYKCHVSEVIQRISDFCNRPISREPGYIPPTDPNQVLNQQKYPASS